MCQTGIERENNKYVSNPEPACSIGRLPHLLLVHARSRAFYLSSVSNNLVKVRCTACGLYRRLLKRVGGVVQVKKEEEKEDEQDEEEEEEAEAEEEEEEEEEERINNLRALLSPGLEGRILLRRKQ
ncbi:hypothetical protein M0804_002838 [Polistes exclamans]|nr:hypothetical protein M0804_002838 [Polistes exclamans]